MENETRKAEVKIDLELLQDYCDRGFITGTAEIVKTKITLKTLTLKEYQGINVIMTKWANQTEIWIRNEYTKELLAKAITKIGDLTQTQESIKSYLDEKGAAFIQFISDEYNALETKMTNMLKATKGEDLKNS